MLEILIRGPSIVEAGPLVVSELEESNDDRDDDDRSQESWESKGWRRRKTILDKSAESVVEADVISEI